MIKRAAVIDLFVIASLALTPVGIFVIGNGFSTIPIITELNISPRFFFSNLFYRWHPYYEAGFDNSQSAWFIFPLGLIFTALASLGIGSGAVSLFFHFSVYFLHGIAMYYLMLVIENIEGPLPRFSKIIAASLYMFNPFTLLYIHELGSQQLLASAILPLMLALLIRGFLRRKLSYCMAVGLVSVLAGVNITFFVINILVLLAYVFYDLVVSRGTNLLWKSGFTTIMLAAIFVSNAYWLLPRISNLTVEISAAFRGAESISGSLFLNSLTSSYFETFRLMGTWAFQPSYFSFYHSYFSPILVVVTFANPFIAISALILRPKKKIELFLALVAIICIPLAVAAYPISNPHLTGKIYIWLYQNFPFFIIFRGAYKFVMVIALSYSVLVGLALAEVVRTNLLKVWNRKALKLVTLCFLMCFLLLGSFPSFSGQLVEKEKSFSIPPYYYGANEWLQQQSGSFRIMTIPEMRHVQYIWDGETKFTGTDVSIPIFKVPVVGRSYYLSLGSADTDEVTHQLYRMIMANQTHGLAEALNLLNVRYVMVHGDYKWSALEWNLPPQYLIAVLKKTPNMVFAKSFGELFFFENSIWSDSTMLIVDALSEKSLQSLFTFVNSDFDPEIDENTSNWNIVDDLLVDTNLHSYDDDVVLSKNRYTDLTLSFDAKSSNGYLHVYFFAIDNQNAYRLWINNTYYELSKVKEGKNAVIRVQQHGLSLNVSVWNSYKIKIEEGTIEIALNGERVDIEYEDRDYITGKIGFASTSNIIWIDAIKLQSLSVVMNALKSHVSSYVRLNPTRYAIPLENISNSIFLIFTESFHEGWNAYFEDNASAKIRHINVFNYSNGWQINRTGEFVLALEYTPQRFYTLGLKISLSSLWILLTLIVVPHEKLKELTVVLFKTLKKLTKLNFWRSLSSLSLSDGSFAAQ